MARVPTVGVDVPDAIRHPKEAGYDEEWVDVVWVGLPRAHERQQAQVDNGRYTKKHNKPTCKFLSLK
jgi:hypothetical protein